MKKPLILLCLAALVAGQQLINPSAGTKNIVAATMVSVGFLTFIIFKMFVIRSPIYRRYFLLAIPIIPLDVLIFLKEFKGFQIGNVLIWGVFSALTVVCVGYASRED